MYYDLILFKSFPGESERLESVGCGNNDRITLDSQIEAPGDGFD
jgi:hypothetical protein